MPVAVRPTTPADLSFAREIAPWAQPDGWRSGSRSVVALDPSGPSGRVVGTAIAMPNAVHPGRARLLVCVAASHRRRGVGSALVNWMRGTQLAPFAAKAEPGSVTSRFWRSMDAERYQLCPAQRLDLRRLDVLEWARAVPPVGAVPASDVPVDQLVDAVTDRYLRQHAAWSPVSSRSILRPVIDDQVRDDTDLPGSYVTLRDGRITAVADLYPSDGTSVRTCAVEAVDPDAAHARSDVAACAASVIRHAAATGASVLEFDGHVTDPHFFPMLRSIPAVGGAECELLEIPPL